MLRTGQRTAVAVSEFPLIAGGRIYHGRRIGNQVEGVGNGVVHDKSCIRRRRNGDRQAGAGRQAVAHVGLGKYLGGSLQVEQAERLSYVYRVVGDIVPLINRGLILCAESKDKYVGILAHGGTGRSYQQRCHDGPISVDNIDTVNLGEVVAVGYRQVVATCRQAGNAVSGCPCAPKVLQGGRTSAYIGLGIAKVVRRTQNIILVEINFDEDSPDGIRTGWRSNEAVGNKGKCSIS